VRANARIRMNAGPFLRADAHALGFNAGAGEGQRGSSGECNQQFSPHFRSPWSLPRRFSWGFVVASVPATRNDSFFELIVSPPNIGGATSKFLADQ
jgi:hypothetical protein